MMKDKSNMTLFERNKDKARTVAGKFGLDFLTLAGANFDSLQIVINATPLCTRRTNRT